MNIFNRENPCKIRLSERARLSGIGSEKEIYKLVFDAKELDYLPGDSLAIFSRNDFNEVQEILGLLNLTGDERVSIKNATFSIRQALIEKYCVTHLTKRFLSTFCELLGKSEKAIFEKVFTDDNDGQYSLLELLKYFPSVRLTPDELCRLLKKNAPRFYSIASAKALQNDKIHLLVRTVGYRNFLGNLRYGVVSHFLNYRLKIGEYVDAYVSQSSFKLPDDPLANIIMVGPGTGLAPFMSFLYDIESKKKQTDIGQTWLFFGDQHEATDFIERDELTRLLNEHVLTRLDLAFSRDQETKIYVQDRMWEMRDELWAWLDQGASLYICGNASHMAIDVEKVLKNIAIFCGGLTDNSVEDWLSDLRSNGRYQKDVY
ncbi:MAG: hypothetical protein K2L13_02695 [Opitutales bacterium]|nr:hypothetical protein [Opitutales bacterium]